MRAVDRALGISKRVVTNASVECWANPVRTCCPTDRNATAVLTSVIFPVLKRNCCCCPVWGHIYTPSMSTRVGETRTENKCSWQSINVMTSLVTWRRNIHSLLTLAAEPSKPNVGAAVQPRGWSVSQGWEGMSLKTDLWRLNGKVQPKFVHTAPSGRKGLLVWSLPSLCCRKK